MIINCNGMPRSGSTLHYNLLKTLLDCQNLNVKFIGYLEKADIEEMKLDLIKYAEDSNKIYVLKTHDYSFLNKMKNVYTIYSYRDIRDVAASSKNKFRIYEKELIEFLLNVINTHNKIINNTESILILRYEDIINDLSKIIQMFSEFLNIQFDKNCINLAIEENHIEEVIKKQNNLSIVNLIKEYLYFSLARKNKIKKFFPKKIKNKIKKYLYPHDKDTLYHKNHISNKGKSGIWQEKLSENEKIMIINYFQDWLLEYGYESKLHNKYIKDDVET